MRHERFLRSVWLVPLLILAACGEPEEVGADVELQRQLSGANEVPPLLTGASGSLDATLRGDVLTIEGEFEGLEGDLLEVAGAPAHVHEAPPGENGGVVFPLEVDAGADDRSGTFALEETLTDAQRQAFLDGDLYVNVHSTVHPGGELRAQLHDEDPAAPGDLATVARSVPELAGLVAALDDAGVTAELEPVDGTFTVLAPNDDALAAAEADLPTDEAALAELLRGHVLEGEVTFDELAAQDEVVTLGGTTIAVTTNAEGDVVLGDGATVVRRNVLASNGLVHVLDGVLLPDEEPAPGEPTVVVTSLSGAEEVPPVTTEATGMATLTLDGDALSLDGTFSGLTSDVTAAHVHGPAEPGVNAGIVFPLDVAADEPATSGTLSGAFALSEAQLADLEAGLYYVNVHSVEYPAGEIRGQIVLPEP